MHEFELINNYFLKIAKKNKSALNLNDDVFFDKKKGVVISVDTYNIGSHFLNIDAPGKAKIYAIHWLIFTGIYVAIVIGIISFFISSAQFAAAQQIGGPGSFRLFLFGTIYYSLIYYVGVLLGTARFARSSVLFANKLPGNL